MPDFAVLETRLNRVAAAHLSNRLAVFATGTVDVVFDSVDEGIQAGPGAARPARVIALSAPEADFAAVAPKRGDTVSIGDVDYELVAKDADPAGWTTWKVRRK